MTVMDKTLLLMKKLGLFLLATGLLYFSACDPVEPAPEETTLHFNFAGQYDGQTLVLNQSYPFTSDMDLMYSTLLFYVSDVRLVTVDDQEVVIKDVDMVNFYDHHTTAATASEGETLTFEDVPEGEYKAIRFGIGLPADLNATNPADYPSTHPMSRTEMYWDWRGTFIFSMIEGSVDTLQNGTPDVFLTYHSGSDAMYEQVELPYNFTISGGDELTVPMTLDAKKILYTTEGPYDVKNNNVTHTTTDDYHIAETVIRNLAKAIAIKN